MDESGKVVPITKGNKWLGFVLTNNDDEASVILWFLKMELSLAWIKKDKPEKST